MMSTLYSMSLLIEMILPHVPMLTPMQRNMIRRLYVRYCAGTTVTDDLNAGDCVIGRVRQQVKENRAHEYLK